MGTGYIKSSEYEAWARLNRVKISASEVQILKAIDRAYVAFRNPSETPQPQVPGSLFKQLVELKQQQTKEK